MKKPAIALAVVSVTALALSGCASSDDAGATADGKIAVTASTNIYGSLAEEIGGDRVEVTTLIDSASKDPHSYEASARDRLTVQKSDLVIENGGGYDAFMDTLLQGSDAEVLTAVEYSGAHPESKSHADEHAEDDHADDEHGDHADAGHDHIEGFNEHVWFDPHTMVHVVEQIAAELTELDPDGKKQFADAADAVIAEIEKSEVSIADLKKEFEGTGVFITEPLPGYLADEVGLKNLTPEGFAESVEEGADVAPATLLAAENVVKSGDVRVLLTNAQTGGPETERVEKTAKDADVPVVAFTELLTDGSSYAEWMADAITTLADALRS